MILSSKLQLSSFILSASSQYVSFWRRKGRSWLLWCKIKICYCWIFMFYLPPFQNLWCWFNEYNSWSTNHFYCTCAWRKPCPNFCIDWDRSRDSISMQRNNGTSSAQVKNTLKVCLLNLVKFKLTKTNLPV